MTESHIRKGKHGVSFAEGSRSRNAGGSSPAGLAAIQRVETDSAYLYQIIEAISSGPDLKTILRRILRLVTEATHCHAAFIYFLQRDRLVLGAASPRYAHLEGEISFPVDEGLTGWVASRRQPAFIRDHASGDPRFHSVPQLDEDLESLASVPILGRSREVIGAITSVPTRPMSSTSPTSTSSSTPRLWWPVPWRTPGSTNKRRKGLPS